MEYPLCEIPQEEFNGHGCVYCRIVDGKRVCAGSPCAEFFRKRLAAVEAERDEMRKQMLEELGRADILEGIANDFKELTRECVEHYCKRCTWCCRKPQNPCTFSGICLVKKIRKALGEEVK